MQIHNDLHVQQQCQKKTFEAEHKGKKSLPVQIQGNGCIQKKNSHPN
jgi:hypothetical protein